MTLEQIGLKVMDISNDIKWLIKENRRINGSMADHIKESDNFRKQVTRNTEWRWVYKICIGAIFTILGYMIFKGFGI